MRSAQIVTEHLPDLAKNRMPKVARSMGIEVDRLKSLVLKLKGLDPCPGRTSKSPLRKHSSQTSWSGERDGQWQVYLDDARVPPLRVVPEV